MVPLRQECLPLLFCLLVGLAVSLLPHFLSRWQHGDWVWFMNHDELEAYAPTAAHSYHNHPFRLGDYFLSKEGRTNFPGLQLLPPVLLAKFLGLGPELIPLVWRVVMGLMVPASLYLLARQMVSRVGAVVMTCVLMLDHGALYGRLFDRQLVDLVRVHSTPEFFFGRDGSLVSIWRITPALPLPFLLFLIAALIRGRREDCWKWRVVAGVAMGVVFYSYFYFWTAAAIALVFLFLFDSEARRFYFHSGWIGALLGLPQVLHGSQVKKELGVEWFQRMETFLPVGRFAELQIPPVASLMALVTFLGIWVRWRAARPLAAVTLVALLFQNHQLVTGLQMENFHWSYAWGPCLMLSCLYVGARLIPDSLPSWVRPAGFLLLGIHAAIGFYMRGLDYGRFARVNEVNRGWRLYRERNRSTPAPEFDRRWRVAGDPDFGLYTKITGNVCELYGGAYYSQTVSADMLMDIYALNQFLRGIPEEMAVERAPYRGMAGDGRDPEARKRREDQVRSRYRVHAADAAPALDRYGVGYLALPQGSSSTAPSQPKSGWTLMRKGPTWTLWSREVREPQPATDVSAGWIRRP